MFSSFWLNEATYIIALLTVAAVVHSFWSPKPTIPTSFAEQRWNILIATGFLLLSELFELLVTIIDSSLDSLPQYPFITTLIRVIGAPIELVAIWLFIRIRFHQFLKMGISIEKWTKNILIGVKWVFTFQLIFFLIISSIGPDRLSNSIGRGRAPASQLFEAYTGYWGMLLGSLVFSAIFLFSGVLEEVLFRGIYYNALRRKFNPLIGVLISSTIFMFAHREVSFVIFIYGCLFAYLYEKSGSLIPPTILHIAINVTPGITIAIAKRGMFNFENVLHAGILIVAILLAFTWILSAYMNGKKVLNGVGS
jgi:membrane protease YdiL (CAAX protease family)